MTATVTAIIGRQGRRVIVKKIISFVLLISILVSSVAFADVVYSSDEYYEAFGEEIKVLLVYGLIMLIIFLAMIIGLVISLIAIKSKKTKVIVAISLILGFLILLPIVYFIMPSGKYPVHGGWRYMEDDPSLDTVTYEE